MIKQILLIDDDEDEHLIFRYVLNKMTIKTTLLHAYNATEAFQIIADQLPDIIFVDHNMPGNNGIECLRDIRAQYGPDTFKIFLYSTGIDAHLHQRAIDAGADGCFKKDSNLDEVLQALEKICAEE